MMTSCLLLLNSEIFLKIDLKPFLVGTAKLYLLHKSIHLAVTDDTWFLNNPVYARKLNSIGSHISSCGLAVFIKAEGNTRLKAGDCSKEHDFIVDYRRK